MLKVYEIPAKTILNKSDLADFSLNCYCGCSHKCLYCYGRYMKKFKHYPQNWGDFVEVKINAPQVLAKEIQKIKPLKKVVFMSSICDGWQPLEAKYQLSRACLKILLENGWEVSILTKSSLIQRDFDLLGAYKTPNLACSSMQVGSLGMTITTLNTRLKNLLEPYASSPQERLDTLRKAQEKRIKIWVFLGPLIPEFTDTLDNLKAIFQALAGLNLEEIYVDRLNLRWQVLESLKRGLGRQEYLKTKILLYKCLQPEKYRQYSQELKEKAYQLAQKTGLVNQLKFCF